MRRAPDTVTLKTPLSRRALRPIHRRTLLGLTEVLIIRMTAPQLLTRVIRTKSRAHLISHTEVKAALLVHGVINAREFGEFGPFQLEWVIQKTVIRVYISVELLLAATGPVISVKRSLDQGSHNAAHTGLI